MSHVKAYYSGGGRQTVTGLTLEQIFRSVSFPTRPEREENANGNRRV